jgi:hypothetical protein
MSLRRFQESFSRFLLASELDRDFDEFSHQLSESGNVSPRKGFGAYRGTRVGGLASALSDFFQTTRAMTGEECFDLLAGQFAKRYPAMCGNLNDYGEFFPNFVGEEMADAPFLAELATLDWHWHKLFYERDESPLIESDLALAATADPDTLYFQAPKGMKLLESDYPLLKIRHYAQQSECQRRDDQLTGDGCQLVLWRFNYERRIELLDATAWNFLRAVQDGQSFQQIAESVFAELPETSLGSTLHQAIVKGWIVGINTSASRD